MLEIRDMVCGYGGVTALRGISLEVKAGQLVALIGANGAGKSTTLRAISGLVAPRSGSMRFEGKEIAGAKPPRVVAAGIAHCPEGRRVFPHMTVEENLDMGAYLRTDRGRDRGGPRADLWRVSAPRRAAKAGGGHVVGRRAADAGDRPGADVAAAPDHVRRAVARACAQHRRATFAIIRGIRDAGTTVLLVEQNAFAALEMCDHAYLLEGGRIVLSGPGAR